MSIKFEKNINVASGTAEDFGAYCHPFEVDKYGCVAFEYMGEYETEIFLLNIEDMRQIVSNFDNQKNEN